MKLTGRTILTAVMVAGVVAGFVAIALLPGGSYQGAKAHTIAGVEIIDTQALCESSGHNLNAADATITHGPTTEGVAGVNEVQSVSIGGAPPRRRSV